MSQFALLLILALSAAGDWPRKPAQSGSPNQRIEELQNRHDRRFRSNWSPPSPSRNRWR